MSQVVKVTPKNLYSNYSILTISEIIQDEQQNLQETQQSSPPLQLSSIPFKGSNRKMLRTSKR
jgi:hypothetical protein